MFALMKLCGVERCIYGLNDASRSWYERVKEMLLGLAATISAYDNHCFNGELSGMLVSHVDDFAFSGDARFQTEVIEQLKSILKVGLYANGSFKYLGLNVIQSDIDILVNQELYGYTYYE